MPETDDVIVPPQPLPSGRPLFCVEIFGSPQPTTNERVDYYWRNDTGGMVFLVGHRPWLGASMGGKADLALNVWITDDGNSEPRLVHTDPRDRYGDPPGIREPIEWFTPHYFEIPPLAWVTMQVRGAAMTGTALGQVHGTCLLYLTRERP